METANYRKASIYFDDETVLEVTQRGGGGSGVGGETGLEAVNLKTGESTNAALAAKDETIAEQAATIEELQEELANVPTVEALSVTANGTYSEAGKAYSPVSVNVPDSGLKLINGQFRFINNLAQDVFIYFPIYNPTGLYMASTGFKVAANTSYNVPADIAIKPNGANPSILLGVDVDPSLYEVSASPTTSSGTTAMTASKNDFRRIIQINFAPNDGSITARIGDVTITPIT